MAKDINQDLDENPSYANSQIFKAMVWIGIIEQLSRNKVERRLAGLNLTFPEFSTLSHFSHKNPPLKTVNLISRVMQQPQPNVSKTIKKMLSKGLIGANIDPQDSRSKQLYITPFGTQTFEKAVAMLTPSISPAFDNWNANELAGFFEKLDNLKTWLDNNRD